MISRPKSGGKNELWLEHTQHQLFAHKFGKLCRTRLRKLRRRDERIWIQRSPMR